MRGWLKFQELMDRSDVVALANRMDGDVEGMAFPQWLYQFMALTWACSVAGPEEELEPDAGPEHGYARTGVCVFYVPQVDEGEPTGAYDAWTCELTLGESLYFTFQAISPEYGKPPENYRWGEDTSWTIPPAGEPATQEHMGWQQRTFDLLAGSLWRVVQAPETLMQPAEASESPAQSS